jgi:hypothetical protein
MLALFPIFGTWTWCNLGFAGAWQIALGLALLGQVAALYFTLVRPTPFVAGAFFTLAFGNRTELLITLPIYVYLFWRLPAERAFTWKNLTRGIQENSRMLISLLSLPITLALLTAAYNFARFHSIFDFGYIHIPEVAQELVASTGCFDSVSVNIANDAVPKALKVLITFLTFTNAWLPDLPCQPFHAPISPGGRDTRW